METVVEFKAGLMALTGGRLVPDTRKGLIRVCQVRLRHPTGRQGAQLPRAAPFPNATRTRCLPAQDEAGLAHFCWFVRDAAGNPAGEPEKDIVMIPGESTFSKVGRRTHPHAGPVSVCSMGWGLVPPCSHWHREHRPLQRSCQFKAWSLLV